MKKYSLIIAGCALTLASCMTTSTTVGSYNEDPGKQYTYATGKQLWIGFGLLPIGKTTVATPADGNCEVISKFVFGDFLISSLTGGILTSRTIIIKDKK